GRTTDPAKASATSTSTHSVVITGLRCEAAKAAAFAGDSSRRFNSATYKKASANTALICAVPRAGNDRGFAPNPSACPQPYRYSRGEPPPAKLPPQGGVVQPERACRLATASQEAAPLCRLRLRRSRSYHIQ